MSKLHINKGETLAEVFAKNEVLQEVADELKKVVVDNPYILWIDHGSYEGWEPRRFANLDDVAKHIQEGGTYGEKFLVTKEIPLKLVEQL